MRRLVVKSNKIYKLLIRLDCFGTRNILLDKYTQGHLNYSKYVNTLAMDPTMNLTILL